MEETSQIESFQTDEYGSGHFEHANTLFAEPIFNIKGIEITNALATSWLALGVIVFFVLLLRASMRTVPGKIQHLFELLAEGTLNLCDQVTGDRRLSLKIFPLVISLFIFVLVNNWLGLLPLTAIGIVEHGLFTPFLRSGTADLNTTLALALVAVVGSNLFGILTLGIWSVFNKYVNLRALGTIFTTVRKEPTVIVVAPIKFFVGLLEIIGELAKIASLSFRLFGNVFAGEILLVSMSVLVAYIVPLPFLFLEILVGFVQALIFAMITLVYFTIASHDHEHEHVEEATKAVSIH